MNKTKIEWCDESWNPVTGCLHDCEYCYAKQMVNRWQGYTGQDGITTYNPYDGLAVLKMPLMTTSKFGESRRAAFPYGFDPTLHEYRLDEPFKKKTGKTIFVCSMADLFGEWVPDEWIETVFEACKKAPWHRYLFLTKNPARYIRLAEEGKLPTTENVWYGSTCTESSDSYFFKTDVNTFVSIEPLLSDFEEASSLKLLTTGIGWVIIGAETGSRKVKTVPERKWVENIVDTCKDAGVPVFMKDSLIDIWGEPLLRQFPWRCSA